MKRQTGSILVIVLILAAAFYLLASLVLIVHRQYIDDVDLTQRAMLSRQKLLQNSQMDWGREDHELPLWPHCNEIVSPNADALIWQASERIWLSQWQLPNECGYGQDAAYLWFKEADWPLPLQVNVMIPKAEHWQKRIEAHDHGIDIERTDDGWQLVILMDDRTSIIALPQHDADILRWQRFRVMDDHYEAVLLWQMEKDWMLEHLVLPFDQVTLGKMHQDSIRRVNHFGEGRLIINRPNEQHLANWSLIIPTWQPQHIEVADDVIWLTLSASHERALMAVYLDGETFYGEDVIGVIRTERELSEHTPMIIKPCEQRMPWIIDGQWQVGCRAQKRVRYVFVE